MRGEEGREGRREGGKRERKGRGRRRKIKGRKGRKVLIMHIICKREGGREPEYKL